MIKFLIVDDSLFSRKTTAYLLRKLMPDLELRIEFAADGLEGLEKFRSLKPDYIFVDLLMPGLSGADLIRKIGEEGGANIIVVTADVQKRVREEIVEEGHVTAFLNKPLNEDKMRSLCDRIRDGKDGSRKLSV